MYYNLNKLYFCR